MDDGAIRRCLGDIRWSPEIPSPAGTVAILRTRVEAAGADVDEVDLYVIRHGGQVRRTTDRHRHGWDGNFGARIDGVVFYVVPQRLAAGMAVGHSALTVSRSPSSERLHWRGQPGAQQDEREAHHRAGADRLAERERAHGD